MTTKKAKLKAMNYLETLNKGPLTLGDIVHSIRTSEGMTQNDLAEKLGISKSHLSDIENGRKTVSPERAMKFAEILGYSKKQFVRLALQQILDDSGIEMLVEVA